MGSAGPNLLCPGEAGVGVGMSERSMVQDLMDVIEDESCGCSGK